MIYQAVNLSPSNTAIDASATNRFSWSSQGSAQTHFQVKIYLNSTGALVRDSTKTASANEYYDLTSAILTNGLEYKWLVTTWSGADYADSEYEFVKANAIPVVAFTAPAFVGVTPLTITTQSYNFVMSYTNASNIKKFKFILYDSAGTTIIGNSDWIYDLTTEYTFEGMIDTLTYKVIGYAVNQYDQEGNTGLKTFTANYTYPEILPNIYATADDENGNISISWDNLDRVLGVVTGSSSYVEGKFNQGIELETSPSTTLVYSETFSETSYTFTYWFKMPYDFNGNFMKLSPGKYIGRYTEPTQEFYINDNGVINTSELITLYTWEDLSYTSLSGMTNIWQPFEAYTWDSVHFEEADFTYNWIFIGITPDDIIIKLHNELRASITIA